MKLTHHWAKLRRAITKKKKEIKLLQGKNSTFLEAWEKETSNTVTLLPTPRKKEEAEKCCTNEGTD